MIFLGSFSLTKSILKKMKRKFNPKRGVAFKTTKEELQSPEDASTESDEDFMTVIARGLKRMSKSRRFDPKNFYKKGSSSKKTPKGNKFSASKNETDLENRKLSLDALMQGLNHKILHLSNTLTNKYTTSQGTGKTAESTQRLHWLH